MLISHKEILKHNLTNTTWNAIRSLRMKDPSDDFYEDILFTYTGLKPTSVIVSLHKYNTQQQKHIFSILEELHQQNPSFHFKQGRKLYIANQTPLPILEPFQYFRPQAMKQDGLEGKTLLQSIEYVFEHLQGKPRGDQYLSYLLGYGPTYHTYRTPGIRFIDIVTGRQEKESRYIHAEDIVYSQKHYALIHQSEAEYAQKLQGFTYRQLSDELTPLGFAFIYSKQDMQSEYLQTLKQGSIYLFSKYLSSFSDILHSQSLWDSISFRDVEIALQVHLHKNEKKISPEKQKIYTNLERNLNRNDYTVTQALSEFVNERKTLEKYTLQARNQNDMNGRMI